MLNFLFGEPCHLPEFTKTDDYKMWAKGRSRYCNIFAYLDFVAERNYATRLEF